MSTALNGAAAVQARGEVAGQRHADPSVHTRVANGAQRRQTAPYRCSSATRSPPTCKEPGDSSPLTTGSKRGATLELISFRLRIEGIPNCIGVLTWGDRTRMTLPEFRSVLRHRAAARTCSNLCAGMLASGAVRPRAGGKSASVEVSVGLDEKARNVRSLSDPRGRMRRLRRSVK